MDHKRIWFLTSIKKFLDMGDMAAYFLIIYCAVLKYIASQNIHFIW